MNKNRHFWGTMLIRGFVALLVGSFVLVVPDMARILLLLPFAIAISILGLAAYGVIDSTLVLISSFMTESLRTQIALLVQGIFGLTIGVLFLSIVFNQVQLEWFLSLAALQALGAGIGEIAIARRASTASTSTWNYAAGVIAVCVGIAYVTLRLEFAHALTARELSWLVYGYLVAFGIAQCLVAARMLYSNSENVMPEGVLTPNREISSMTHEQPR